MSGLITLGVAGTSLKENEKRVAIHPAHLAGLPENILKQITFEKGYGLPFGLTDEALARQTSGRVARRSEILNGFDCVLLPKPLPADLQQLRNGALLWGWPHCVEQRDITQLAIDKKLTLIAWENMHIWGADGERRMHVFYRNNEMAGYAGVNHALALQGLTASYGPARKVAMLSFGSVSRGAIYALRGQGFHDITVYTIRPVTGIRDRLPGVIYRQMRMEASGKMFARIAHNSHIPFAEALTDKDIIINGTLQDTDRPKMFVSAEEAKQLKPGALIIDVSCDAGMGFWCARPTSFENPLIETEGIFYYAVDHTPSYYWRSASWEISQALLPYVPIVLSGPLAWHGQTTLSKAIDIEQGVIRNPKILSFQKREKPYPHDIKQGSVRPLVY